MIPYEKQLRYVVTTNKQTMPVCTCRVNFLDNHQAVYTYRNNVNIHLDLSITGPFRTLIEHIKQRHIGRQINKQADFDEWWTHKFAQVYKIHGRNGLEENNETTRNGYSTSCSRIHKNIFSRGFSPENKIIMCPIAARRITYLHLKTSLTCFDHFYQF